MKKIHTAIFIFALFVGGIAPSYADGTHPQGIKLDGTVGTAGKIDLPGPNYAIKPEYGKQSGANLFHSFQQFNVHKNESATFSGPASVKNIISRVTGGSASWIDGKLASTIPGADLYFLNPFGVMFGSNASLDLTGSFHVSTADYLKMGDNERFYSKPIENEVLSVAAPSAFGFLSDKPAMISIEGKGQIPEDQFDGKPSGLRVPEGKTISLIGGDIEIKGGFFEIQDEMIIHLGGLYAPTGRINIASVASAGEVVPTDNELKVSSSQKGNISLSDGSKISVSENGRLFIRGRQFVAKDSVFQAISYYEGEGGIVDIQADNISFKNGTYIDATCYNYGTGYVTLKASESVSFGGECCSAIWIEAYGKLAIDAKNISFADGAYIYGGDIKLKASESVSFSGESSNGVVSMIGTSSVTDRDLGKLLIDAKNISFTDGAYINLSTYGKGNGGAITLKAAESILFSGYGSISLPSGIGIGTEKGGGDAGKLLIDAKNISFNNGAFINSSTYGTGKGGEVSLKAVESVSFTGEGGKAETGGIFINTSGAGDAGKLTIDAKNIFFSDGTAIKSNAYSTGNGGAITLKAAESVSFSGEDSKAGVSRIETVTTDKEEGAGDAGKLTVDAKNISFADGSSINSKTYGNGNGGEVTLKASESVSFSGESSKANPSVIGIETSDTAEGAGNGGKLTIEAENISFTGGAAITSNTQGKGKGGEITLKAAESVSFSGEDSNAEVSRILVNTQDKEEGAGDAGKLTIDAQNISFTNGAGIGSDTYGKGKGGDVFLKASKSISFSGESSKASDSVIRTQTYYAENGAGDAGKVILEAKDISFTGGAFITASSHGRGKGGEVILQASGSVSFSGEDSKAGQSAIEVGAYYTGDGAGDSGSIMIQAKDIFFTNGATIDSSTDGKGKGGEITLKASESVSFSGENSKTKTSRIESVTTDKEADAGDAGKLTIEAENISFADGAVINSGTIGSGKGGEIAINARETVRIFGTKSNGASSFFYAGSYSTDESAGAGGKIFVSAQKLQISDKGQINTSSEGGGQAGDISLHVGNLEMHGGASVSSDATLSGGGRITIDAKDTVHLTDSKITTNVSSGTEKGGDITIGNPDTGTGSKFVILNRSHIQANAQDGDGGAVFVITENFLKSFGSIVEATSARGNEGTVKIDAPDLDISGGLTILPVTYFDATRWASTPCEARSSDEPESRFEVRTHILHPVPFGDQP